LHGPFIVLLEEYGADQPSDSGFVGKDAGDIATPSPRKRSRIIRLPANG
jgi:hypothetical protein